MLSIRVAALHSGSSGPSLDGAVELLRVLAAKVVIPGVFALVVASLLVLAWLNVRRGGV